MDTKSQLWALLGSVAVWLAGQAWSYVRSRLDAGQRQDLSNMERWAQKAAAWALVMFPGLDPGVLTDKALGELRKILSNVGLNPDDATWAHLTEVVHEFIVNQLLAKSNGIATSPGAPSK